jgi:dynactin complex subunit
MKCSDIDALKYKVEKLQRQLVSIKARNNDLTSERDALAGVLEFHAMDNPEIEADLKKIYDK